ncbi:MAG TPA: cell division protein ZipA C-terminal FtsZ-binding domain-containing protein [Burkholderiales bacterium]|nr:cell division protein ZipA C-terminal FtsZ-binding domain-containing protein [Burkholderiales bacterium]
MSDLQLSLLIIGILIVAATYFFNRFQERKYRRKSESAFENDMQDVLLSPQGIAGVDDGRVEPQLREPVIEAKDTVPEQRAPLADKAPAVLDPEIMFIAEISRADSFPPEVVKTFLKYLLEFGRRITCLGFREKTSTWERLEETADARYIRIRVGLQLADRSGFVNESQLALFCDMLQGFAENTGAAVQFAERRAALSNAVDLDKFCAEVDISIGLNVVAQDGQTFHGTKLRALSEAAGFRLQEDATFHYLDEHGESLFTLSCHEPVSFTSEQIKNISVRGVTFLLDVPRVANGMRVFDKMLTCARQFAASLDGVLVDDNRIPLNDSGIERIRQQLSAVYTAMDQRNISAGSPRALRLFS